MIGNPRLNLLIATYGRSLAIALAVVGVLAVVATGWVVATPSTSTTTQQVNQETVSTETTTSAVVVEDGLWESGTRLVDSSVYTFAATPNLTITPRTAVASSEASVIHEVRIRHEAARDGSVFWEETVPQSRTEASVVDGVATSETTITVDDVRDQRAALEDDLVDVGSITTSIEVVVEYDTGTYADEQVLSSPVRMTEDAYWLEEPLEDSTDHSETATIEVQESPNAPAIGVLLLVAVLSFGGAAFVYTRGPIDVDAARRAVYEQRYAEWISRGSIPMWVGDYHVELDTLEDVVDVAIDTNERVVNDRQRDLFAVVNGNVVYYYSDRGQWEGTAWPKMEFGDQSSPVTGDSGATPVPPSIDGGSDPIGPPDDDLPDPDDDDAWERI
ncbi:DUF5305 domain-containing protein [Halosolutus amylolyticus]|uniref:DUF5305 domain-containing protein n=1 Tax=Halosolutus amylolyticus TaxID=2932267 RepID=A0ABD5PQ28_9EURY|nr:DUF5305 domain-containing protein [Halosolutus amylolyticus]